MLKRYSDPKILREFLYSVVREIENMVILDRKELLPVEIAPAGFVEEKPALSKLKWKTVRKYHSFNPDGRKCWLRKTTTVPQKGKDTHLALKFICGDISEGLLYINGKIHSGISTAIGIWDSGEAVMLPDELKPGERIEILIHLYSGSDWGSLKRFEPQTLTGFEILTISKSCQDLHDAFSVALDTVSAMGKESFSGNEILRELEKTYLMLDFTDRERFTESAVRSLRHLEKNIFNGKNLQPVQVGVFGHSHIDVAWLWSLRVTREKAIRTFATQLNLLDSYKDWVFQQGQAQLYSFLKKDAPSIYQRIKNKVKGKRWEPSGAVWVETDTNIPCGESIIRQIMYGKRFFVDEFGLENRTLWLPDVFGYSGSLPQILKKSGIDLFMTTKISWNQYTRFPYDTFWWKGIDGTKILTHFITTPCDRIHTYNTTMTPESIYGTWQEYNQKELNSALLMPFGYGDGGGGPKEGMLRRLNWLRKGVKGFLRVKPSSPEDYREKLLRSVEKEDLPVWEDELYLEHHRGTYTSQSRIKKNNRSSEILLRETEIISLCSHDFKKLSCRLKDAWELLLLNQFHDILPGSSCREVYLESESQFEEVRKICEDVIQNSASDILEKDSSFITVFNPFSWEFRGVAKIPDKRIVPLDLPYQVDDDGVIFRVEGLNPAGFRDIKVRRISPKETRVRSKKLTGDFTLENRFYKMLIGVKNGSILSLIHKETGREINRKGENLNVLEIYEDKSLTEGESAWNIEYMHQYKCYVKNGFLVNPPEIESGNLFQKIKVRKRLLNSIINQEIVLYEEDPLIYFHTTVDWNEKDCALKACFPVDIHANFATYDIQFGNIRRPTHRNTLYDHARFEVCAQKWIDLSEGYFGVSLLTDCKYGYSVSGSDMRITLLRSPTSPDDTADRGRQKFSYCLYAHCGDWRSADVGKLSYQFNMPVRTVAGRLKPEKEKVLREGLLRLSELSKGLHHKGTNVIVETLKASEDGRGIVVRLYECKNSRGSLNLKINLPWMNLRKVYLCDLMEKELRQLGRRYEVQNGINLSYSPYEIITLKFT